MAKTLVTILHFNSFKYTDDLYEHLKPCENNDYDLIVVDNGSETDGFSQPSTEKNKSSKYSAYVLDKNYFFGGGIFSTFDLFLQQKEYDSLLFLNSDLIVSECSWIKTLKNELKNGYEIVSPSVDQYDSNKPQCPWKQMWNWCQSEIRPVKWVDLQAPLMSRKFVEHTFENNVTKRNDYPKYGWGLEVLFGIECEQMNWKIGVCDFTPAIHLGSATIEDNKHLPEINSYCANAEIEQWGYFDRLKLIPKVIEIREWAKNYTI